MAGLAKMLGVLCLLAALLVGLNAVYGFAATDWTAGGDLGDALAVLVIGGQVVFGLLLAAAGAVAWLVAEMATAAPSPPTSRRPGA